MNNDDGNFRRSTNILLPCSMWNICANTVSISHATIVGACTCVIPNHDIITQGIDETGEPQAYHPCRSRATVADEKSMTSNILLVRHDDFSHRARRHPVDPA
jgi:hypothetical protein